VQTLRLVVDQANPESRASRRAIARAAEILRAGGTVAFPTETVYGLGANALDEKAVAKIFAAKERPSWDPLIVHIGERVLLGEVAAKVSDAAERLMDRFWPGPLTLLLPKHPAVPEIVTAGLKKVGVRMPAHPVAHALLMAAGVPVAAPSANRFGHTSATSAEHVAEDLEGRIDAILDGGETTHGVESTVAEPQGRGCLIYRPGVITAEQIRSVCLGSVRVRRKGKPGESRSAVPSPGLSLRHYAPRAGLILVDGVGASQRVELEKAVCSAEQLEERVGVMLPAGFPEARMKPALKVFRWGRWDRPNELARRLYAGLRWLDGAGATLIVCPLPRPVGIGVAIRDRLQRAGHKR
jgi:L-threonylcarbamoyladenylate synthase